MKAIKSLKQKYTFYVLIGLIVIFNTNVIMAKSFKKQVKEAFNKVIFENIPVLQRDDIRHLPLVLQKYLEYTGCVGKPVIKTVRLKQKGRIMTKQGGTWFDLEANEYFLADKPFFFWKGMIKPSPLLFISGVDKFDGNGNLKIKLMGLITIGNEKGPELDQAELLRYLAEMLWFPSVALSSFVKWEEMDALTVKGILEWEGIRAEAVFFFDNEGKIVNIVAERYMKKENGRPIYERWETPIEEYAEFNGYRLPCKGPAIYKLKEGDFRYIEIEVTDIEFNMRKLY